MSNIKGIYLLFIKQNNLTITKAEQERNKSFQISENSAKSENPTTPNEHFEEREIDPKY
jgi:hypothetical protein